MTISVDAESDRGPLPRVWRSTGFTPAALLSDSDMEQSLTYLGSIPHGGMEFVRIHYLLDLVRVGGLVDGPEVDPEYDFARLDRGLDALVDRGIRPVFELMGNPSNRFSDFSDDGELRAWRRLVRDLATHLVERYGRSEVEAWYFEGWNEPDVGFGWEQFAHDVDAFLAHYDACAAGLADADGEFALGGPGTARTRSIHFDRFLEHVDSGTNRLTGEPVRADFISVHEKGRGTNAEDLTIDLGGTLEREREAIEHLRERYPSLAERPFWNEECDPQTGWVDTHTWRARPYYAAAVARLVDDRLALLEEGVDYGLLSSDNAFLGTWGQRTQFARFGEGAFRTDPNRASVRPHYEEFELVKKPVHNVYVALSLLGDRRVSVDIAEEDVGAIAEEDVGAIAARAEGEVTILAYRVRDRPDVVGDGGAIDLRIEKLPFEEGVLARYRIDERHGNPFREWDRMGAPEEPTAEEYDALAAEAEFAPVETRPVDGLDLQTELELPLPGVHLVHLRADPGTPPPAPTDVRLETYPGRTVGEDTLISWEVAGRAVASYEVLAAPDLEGSFERVNETDLIGTAFLDRRPSESRRHYAVRAIDYWGRTGEQSDAIARP